MHNNRAIIYSFNEEKLVLRCLFLIPRAITDCFVFMSRWLCSSMTDDLPVVLDQSWAPKLSVKCGPLLLLNANMWSWQVMRVAVDPVVR